jgi:DNA-binding CsgD family transcriptional regulator
MARDLRPTGVNVLGDLAWGSHVCLFYETRQDLLDVSARYLAAGLEAGEFCVWIVSEPLSIAEGETALRQSVPAFERHRSAGSIEILPADNWYLTAERRLDWQRILDSLQDKLRIVRQRNYAGLRVSSNAPASDTERICFAEYEHAVDGALDGREILVLCTYSLMQSRALDVFDVAREHQISIARRKGAWQFIEAAERRVWAPSLTPREREVVTWVAQGKTAVEIAKILGIAKRTVDEHMHAAMRKLGAANRAQAVAIALRSRMIDI